MSANNVRKVLEMYADIIESEYKNKMKELGLSASGTSISQVKAFLKEESDGIFSIKAPYDTKAPAPLRYAVFGRKPGGIPPVSAIKAWAQKKGLSGIDNKAARNIAYSISKKGTISRFKGKGGGAAVTDLVLKTVGDKLRSDVTDAYVKDLTEILNARN
jgi:hypothetical protein